MDAVDAAPADAFPEDLVRGALAGDAVASRNLYARLVPMVGRFLALLRARRPTPPELIADIAADVLLSVRAFRANSSFTTWVFSVTYRRLATWEGRERRRQAAEREWLSYPRDPPRGPEQTVLERERLSAAIDAVSQFRLRPRTCFILSVVKGMSAQRISKIVGGSCRSVRDSTAYVRTRVREELADQGLLPPGEGD